MGEIAEDKVTAKRLPGGNETSDSKNPSIFTVLLILTHIGIKNKKQRNEIP